MHHEEQWPPVIKASLADVFSGIPAPVTEIKSGISTKSVSPPFYTNGGEDMFADIQRVGFFLHHYTLHGAGVETAPDDELEGRDERRTLCK